MTAVANKRKPAKRRSRPVAKPKALSIPKAHVDQYLDLVASGTESPDAARQVGASYTGRLFRSLAVNDPVFAARLAEAVEEGRRSRSEEYVAELRAARRHVALVEKNPRTLHYESIAYDDDYRAKHLTAKTQVEMTGPAGGSLEVRVDVTFRQLQELLARRAAANTGAVADAHPVVDAVGTRSVPAVAA